jgi:hypothetical protein
VLREMKAKFFARSTLLFPVPGQRPGLRRDGRFVFGHSGLVNAMLGWVGVDAPPKWLATDRPPKSEGSAMDMAAHEARPEVEEVGVGARAIGANVEVLLEGARRAGAGLADGEVMAFGRGDGGDRGGTRINIIDGNSATSWASSDNTTLGTLQIDPGEHHQPGMAAHPAALGGHYQSNPAGHPHREPDLGPPGFAPGYLDIVTSRIASLADGPPGASADPPPSQELASRPFQPLAWYEAGPCSWRWWPSC